VAAKLLCFRNRIASFKMKDGLAFVVLAKPAGFQRDQARLNRSRASTQAKINFRHGCQTFGKIREEFRSYFALIAAGPENPCDNHPTVRFRAQSSNISSV